MAGVYAPLRAGGPLDLATATAFTEVAAGHCTDPVAVHVTAGRRARRVTLRVEAESADGARDADTLALRCRPPQRSRSRHR